MRKRGKRTQANVGAEQRSMQDAVRRKWEREQIRDLDRGAHTFAKMSSKTVTRVDRGGAAGDCCYVRSVSLFCDRKAVYTMRAFAFYSFITHCIMLILIRGGLFRSGGQLNTSISTDDTACIDNQIAALKSIKHYVIDQIQQKTSTVVVADVVTTQPLAHKLLSDILGARKEDISVRQRYETTANETLLSSIEFARRQYPDFEKFLIVRGDLQFLQEMPEICETSFFQAPWQISTSFGAWTSAGSKRVCDTFFFTSDIVLLSTLISWRRTNMSLHDIADVVDVDMFVKDNQYDSDTAKEPNPYYQIINRQTSRHIAVIQTLSNSSRYSSLNRFLGLVLLTLIFMKGYIRCMAVANLTHLFYNHTLTIWGYSATFDIRAPLEPTLVLLNHTSPYTTSRAPPKTWIQDGWLLRELAKHLFIKTGIKSAVLVEKTWMNRNVMQRIIPHYMTYIIDNRTQNAIDMLRTHHVFLFVVNPHVKRFGGTGAYHIRRAVSTPSLMWYLEYCNSRGVVRELQKTPLPGADAKRFVLSLSSRYSLESGVAYNTSFGRVM